MTLRFRSRVTRWCFSMRPVAENVHPVGLPSLKELLASIKTNQIPVYG